MMMMMVVVVVRTWLAEDADAVDGGQVGTKLSDWT